MNLNNRYNIARTMTGSNATNEIIYSQVMNTLQIIKQESCQNIDILF